MFEDKYDSSNNSNNNNANSNPLAKKEIIDATTGKKVKKDQDSKYKPPVKKAPYLECPKKLAKKLRKKHRKTLKKLLDPPENPIKRAKRISKKSKSFTEKIITQKTISSFLRK